MFDDLIKFIEFCLLCFVVFFHNQLLCVDAVVHLLIELLNCGLHPMPVVFRGVDVLLFQLMPNFSPNLSHFEVRVHLNHLEFLLFVGVQIIDGESDSVENRKNYESNIILLHLLTDAINQISFGPSLCQILQVGWLWQVFFGKLWYERFDPVNYDPLLISNSVLLILLAIKLNHKLSCVYH